MQIHLKEVWPIKRDCNQIKVISICKGRLCPSDAGLAAPLANKARNAKVLGRAIPCLQLAGLSLFVEINVSGSLLAEASKHRIPLINPSCSFSHTYQVSFQAGFHALVGLPSWIHTVHNDLNIPGFLTFTFFIINWVIWLLENVVQASELH